MVPIITFNMPTDQQQMKHVLEMLAGGATCDYQPVKGGVLVSQSHEGVDVGTFLELKEQGLIEKQRTDHTLHPIFRPSFQNPIDIYGITDEGRAYLKRQG